VLQHIKIIIDVLIRINTCRVDRGLPGERFKIDLMYFRAVNKVYSFDEPSACRCYSFARTLEIGIFIRLSRDENVYYIIMRVYVYIYIYIYNYTSRCNNRYMII